MNEDRRRHVFCTVRDHLEYAKLGDLAVFIAGAVAQGIETALAWDEQQVAGSCQCADGGTEKAEDTP